MNNGRKISGAEVAGLVPEALARQGQLAYDILRHTSNITVEYKVDCEDPLLGCIHYQEIISTQPVGFNEDNDLVVADYSTRHPEQASHYGPYDANHNRIKNDTVILRVLANIRQYFPIGQ